MRWVILGFLFVLVNGMILIWGAQKPLVVVTVPKFDPSTRLVQMVVTASFDHLDTGERVTSVWIDEVMSLYVCAQMLAFGSYEDEKVDTRNWIDIDCVGLTSGEQITFLTKEKLFPRGTDFKFGPELKEHLIELGAVF